MPDTRISELAAASALDGTETLPVVQSATTKKATVTQVLAGHVAAADPHTGYQKESEKDANSGYPGLAAAQGTRDGTKFLRDDGTWQTPAGGGGGAPTNAPYVTTAADATLTGEKVLGADVIMRNTLTNRPAAGVAGRLFDKTDSDQFVERDNGASWDLFAIKGLVVQDDNVEEGTGIRTLDFGTGLDVAVTGTEAVITAPGGAAGWDFLGSAVLAANANTVPAVTIAARDIISIVIRLAGYDVADLPALRFNADTGTNYNSRHITFAAAGVTGVNTANLSDTMLKVGAGNSVRARHFVVDVGNRLGSNKAATITNSLGATSAATEPVVAMSSGGWFNTTDQITSVQLITVGANLLLAGTGLAIFGRNF